MSTSYVMRIVQDAAATDTDQRDFEHVERWISAFSCDGGLETTKDVGEAMRFRSDVAARKFWLTECPLGYPWDFIDGQTPPIKNYDLLDDDEISQPLTRYTVMIESVSEAKRLDQMGHDARLRLWGTDGDG